MAHQSTGEHAPSFFDVSGISLKRLDDEDFATQSFLIRSRRSVTSPWEFELPPSTVVSEKDQSGGRKPNGLMSSFAFSDNGGLLIGAEKPPHTDSSPDASFAILGDDDDGVADEQLMYPRALSPKPVRRRKRYVFLATIIVMCLIVHVLALLVFFTSWYNDLIQVAIFRRFYAAFSTPTQDSDDDDSISIEAKRRSVAYVYLIAVGLIPTAISVTLWIAFASHRGLRDVLQVPGWLRRKPVLFAGSSKPLYVDATRGELTFLLLLLVANAFVFLQVLLRSKTRMSSPGDKIWRDVGRAFAFNALFTSVMALPFFPTTPSTWSFPLEIFGITRPYHRAKYARWLGLLVLFYALLHAFCMAFFFHLHEEFTQQMLPKWGALHDDSAIKDANGITAFGELALLATLLAALVSLPFLRRCLSVSVRSVLSASCVAIALLAVVVHYPLTLAWLLPPVLLILTNKAASWTQTRYPVEVVDIAPLPNGITRLVLRRNLDAMEAGGGLFTPEQSVFIKLPQLSWFQWHRMPIASSPSRHPGIFAVYAQSPHHTDTPFNKKSWLAGLHDVAKVAYATKEPPVVHCDGFYGPSHASHYEKYRCIVLIAGGLGVTQLFGILEELFHRASRHKERVKPAERGDDESLGAPGDDDDARIVWFLWTCRDVCLFREFEDLFLRIRAFDPTEALFRLRFFLTEIPSRAALQYQPLASCHFAADATHAKAQHGALPDELGRIQRSPNPQNRSGLCCWPSRPFQQALAGSSLKLVAFWLVLIVVVPVSIFVEWHARQSSASVFRPLKRLRDVFFVVGACFLTAVIVSLVSEVVLNWQRRRQPATQTRHRTEPGLPGSQRARPGLRKLASMTRMIQDEEEKEPDVEAGTLTASQIHAPPDVIEKLQILTLKPDLGKFLRTVGRSFPRFAGTIGVFTSGSELLMDHIEAAAIACDAGQGSWKNIDAAFDVLRLEAS